MTNGVEPAVMFMPAPETLRAAAVWITATNWADGLAAKYGRIAVCLPRQTLSHSKELSQFTDASTAATPTRHMSRLDTHARSFAKDLRLLVRRQAVSHRYAPPTWRQPAFVWQHHDILLTAGSKYARRLGVPLVQFVDALQVWESRRWGVARPGWGTALERYAELPQLRGADIVCCVSEEVAASVGSKGVPEDRIIVTPCTANEVAFNPSNDGSVARRANRLDTDDVVFGWAGSFRRFHGLDRAIEAFALTLMRLPKARLLLVGDGPDRSAIESKVLELGLVGYVRFAGHIPHSEMPAHVAAMDVGLVTARSARHFHYSPLKMREYLSSGVPVIAPLVGQLATGLTDAQDALFYPHDDISAMARAMIELGEDSSLRVKIGRSGFEAERSSGGIGAQVDLVLSRLSLVAPVRRLN